MVTSSKSCKSSARLGGGLATWECSFSFTNVQFIIAVIVSEAMPVRLGQRGRSCNAADEVREARLSIPRYYLSCNATGSLDFARDHRLPSSRLFFKLSPHWRVIGRLLACAHFAVDSRGRAFFGERFAGQHGVDAQAAILFKRAHLIIPPTKNFSFFVM